LIKFLPDNFTPLQRTPWGGRKIVEQLKSNLLLQNDSEPPVVGESWEFSLDDDFASRCVEEPHLTLRECFAGNPRLLSPAHIARWGHDSPLLLKLIDAADTLSVQLHPDFEAPGLAAHESGKWEAWIVLHADPGAGIYCGLRPGIRREELEKALVEGDKLKDCLQFREVKPGECYVISPGLVHAIGAGVCLLEPQISQPGHKALTYRLWDWQRKYDERGVLSKHGTARQLHVEQALQCIDFSQTALQALAPVSAPIRYAKDLWVQRLIETPIIVCEIYKGQADCILPLPRELCSICVLRGKLQLSSDSERISFEQGESGVIAASLRELRVWGEYCEFVLTWLKP
jgi:mannose-6-phosphate isomerase